MINLITKVMSQVTYQDWTLRNWLPTALGYKVKVPTMMLIITSSINMVTRSRVIFFNLTKRLKRHKNSWSKNRQLNFKISMIRWWLQFALTLALASHQTWYSTNSLDQVRYLELRELIHLLIKDKRSLDVRTYKMHILMPYLDLRKTILALNLPKIHIRLFLKKNSKCLLRPSKAIMRTLRI